MALRAAVTTSDRVSFHVLNRRTGHRVHRVYIDAETDNPVDREDQVKGYETDDGRKVILEPEDIAAAVPDSDKRLRVEAFILCGEIDTLFSTSARRFIISSVIVRSPIRLACPNPTITEDTAMTTASQPACQRVDPRRQAATLPASYTTTRDTTHLGPPAAFAWLTEVLGELLPTIDDAVGEVAGAYWVEPTARARVS